MDLRDSSFASLLVSFGEDALAEHEGTIYGLWPDLTLAYFNPAWFRFAAENNGEPAISTQWGLGRSVLDAICEELQALYRNAYRDCLSSRAAWNQDYECSSGRIFRRFRMTAYPLADGQGLLVVNSLIAEQPHDSDARPPRVAEDRRYRDERGIVVQCAWCRRIRHPRRAARWDWVPAWVDRPPSATSHGICEPCYGHYFPGR